MLARECKHGFFLMAVSPRRRWIVTPPIHSGWKRPFQLRQLALLPPMQLKQNIAQSRCCRSRYVKTHEKLFDGVEGYGQGAADGIRREEHVLPRFLLAQSFVQITGEVVIGLHPG